MSKTATPEQREQIKKAIRSIKKAPTKKKRGRPKGSKAAPRVEVLTRQTHCPRCKSVDIKVEKKFKELPFNRGFEGIRYRKLVLRRAYCLKCGQRLVSRTHEDPI